MCTYAAMLLKTQSALLQISIFYVYLRYTHLTHNKMHLQISSNEMSKNNQNQLHREAIMIWCEIFLIWNFQTIRMSFCLSYTLSSKYASSPQTHIHLAVKYTILSQMEWTELHTIVVNLFLKLKLLVGTIWRLFYSCKSQSPASIINEVKQWNVGRWKRVREEKNQFTERLNRLYRP